MTLPTIGIGITTRNRPDRARDTILEILKHTPENIRLVIVDDASDEPVTEPASWIKVYRFDENVGIARAKNKCLELLDDCDHIFLFDDDAYPITDDWWRPYIESPEPHLMYIFDDLAGARKLKDITRLYDDGQHVAYSGPRGVMLYIDAKAVLPVVGGMDPIYGLWGYEHGDWSNRIHHAGLTSFRYADVAGSDDFIHSMDQYEEIERSVEIGDRLQLARQNARIHNQRRTEGYQAYVEYRERPQRTSPRGDRDVVITHLYSSKPDPQRPGTQLDAGLAPAAVLIDSIGRGENDTQIVVIGDRLDPDDGGPWIEIVPSTLTANVFFQRHLDSWRYLRDHPEIRYVWCVDATDVEMLHEPWDKMEPYRLYIGYEDTRVDTPWLSKNHRSAIVQEHIASHGDDLLINPGVMGGDRVTVMAFLHDIIRLHFDNLLARFKSNVPADLGDMGVVQVVAQMHRDHIFTGPGIVTKFKANERTSAWWKHK